MGQRRVNPNRFSTRIADDTTNAVIDTRAWSKKRESAPLIKVFNLAGATRQHIGRDTRQDFRWCTAPASVCHIIVKFQHVAGGQALSVTIKIPSLPPKRWRETSKAVSLRHMSSPFRTDGWGSDDTANESANGAGAPQ